MEGTVRVMCTNCASYFRTPVIFPVHNKGFITTEVTCPVCNTKLKVIDPHKYDKKGTIRG